MAKLIRCNEDLYVLLTHDGELLARFDRASGAIWWRFNVVDYADAKCAGLNYASAADLLVDLQNWHGLKVELIDRI